MHCEKLKLGNGVAFVCRGGRRGPRTTCSSCAALAPLVCDWKTGGGKTCDKPICERHAEEVGKNKHLCPQHQKAYALWLAERRPKEQGA